MKHPIPFRKTPLVLAITASLASLTFVQAAPGDPLGPEFQVNTYTTNHQRFPTMAIDADGAFVMAWESWEQDGDDWGIYAQRYDRAGVAQGAEFRVNTYTTGTQWEHAIAMDADGAFVVAWASYSPDGDGFGIYAQRYTQAGVPQGTEFRVNTYTTSYQRDPTVAMDADGDFVVAWESYFQDGSLGGIYAQRYDRTGVPQGNEFRVNDFTTDDQSDPAVVMDADGAFVVAWASYRQDGDGWGIYAQRYTQAGVPQGSEFRVNDFTTYDQRDPTVAMDADGDFVVAWENYSYYQYQNDSYDGIYVQRYTQAGVPQGSEFRVNAFTTNPQWHPAVAMDADGAFVVAWQSHNQDGSYSDISAQRYDRAGTPLGGEFRVNAFTTNHQWLPTVAMDTDSDFVVAWQSYDQDGDGAGIYAQRYAGAAAGGVLTTVGLYDPAASRFYLRHRHAGGPADTTFRFGAEGFSWLPLSGDWDGDGVDTVGLYDPTTSRFYLNNRLVEGAADVSFRFGPLGLGWLPLNGDWNGDGVDTVGLYDPATSRFYLKNSHAGGAADSSFRFGPEGFGWLPVTGQWTGP